ncbi:MAG: hypothetical protein HDR43_01930 [Mycoplasma sp.]|nr:hypothetical protein [Mycoplasma sp.]
MQLQDEIIKWNNLFEENKLFKKELKKIEKIGIQNTNFYDNLNVANNCIYAEYGVGYSKINSITIKKIIDLFLKIIENQHSNNYFLITSDGSQECIEIIKSLLNINNSNIKFITSSSYEGFDKNFILSSIKKINPMAALHLSKSIFDNKIINAALYNSSGIKIGNKVLEGITKKIKKNLIDVELAKNDNMSFLNNELLIKIFSDKIKELFKNYSISRKTKIAISNRSNGITKIISKLVGSQDFSYVINNKIKKREIDLFSTKKHISDNKIKMYFWKDILFARRKKANFLICFNQEGTQLFLFAIHNSKVTYINSNLLTLIYLNHFYNELEMNNQKLTNTFISSNNDPNENIIRLINKYKINFKKITNNDFLTKDFLLIFWNDYNQYVFGDKMSQEFSIYQFLIKILCIIDYYNNQYNSINALLNSLNKMYGVFSHEEKYILDIAPDMITDKIDEVFKNWKQKEVSTKIVNYVNEETIKEIYIDSEFKLNIKYNFIIKKVIMIVSYTKDTNVIKEFQKRIKLKYWIKTLMKETKK